DALAPILDKGCEAPIHGQRGRLAERVVQDGNAVWRFCSSHTCEQQNDTRQRASRDLPIQRRPDSHSHCLTSLILLADRCDAFGSFSIRNTYIIDGFHSYFLSHWQKLCQRLPAPGTDLMEFLADMKPLARVSH